jgi:hypothetical protein
MVGQQCGEAGQLIGVQVAAQGLGGLLRFRDRDGYGAFAQFGFDECFVDAQLPCCDLGSTNPQEGPPRLPRLP